MRNKFKSLHAVLNTLGSILVALSWVILISTVIVLFHNETVLYHYRTLIAFIFSAAIALIIGLLLKTFSRKVGLNLVHAMLVCSISWLVCSIIGAVPVMIIVCLATARKRLSITSKCFTGGVCRKACEG